METPNFNTQTVSMNELIAEFMGISTRNSRTVIEGRRFSLLKYPYGLRYHKSWDWLMPVVEKIGDLYIHHPGRVSEVNRIPVGSHIHQVYKEVVAFIKWYNENKAKEFDL